MQVVSTNTGIPVTFEWMGQPIRTGIFKYQREEPIFLGEEDVVDDHVIDRRYHGGAEKACYLYSADHYTFWKEKYPDLNWQWGMFGENLTVIGLDESEIRIGDRFQIGESVVQVTQPRQPCFKLGFRFGDQSVVDVFWKLLYPGIYVRILQEGKVRIGDQIIKMNQNMESITVSEVFSIFDRNRKNLDLIQKALLEPFLAESCRRDIQKIYDIAK